MPRNRISIIFYSILLLATLATTLEVSPDSPCAQKCLFRPGKDDPSDPADSLTFNPDLACANEEFAGEKSTVAGRRFKECLECQQKSGFEDRKTGERDTGWFLFNNRAAVDWCIFGRFAEEKNPNITDTNVYKKCNSACNPIYSASDFKIKSEPAAYGFCDFDGNFTTDANSCAECLYTLPRFTILGNILTTTVEMCKQKPGKVFDYNAQIYTASRISQPTTTPTGSPTGSPTSTGTNDASPPTSTPGPSEPENNNLSAGAMAGIVIGVVAGIVLSLFLVFFLIRRRRNKNKVIRMPNQDSEGGGQMMNAEHYQPSSTYARSSIVESTHKQHQYAYQQGGNGVPGCTGFNAITRDTPVELGGGQGTISELSALPMSPAELR